MDTQGSHSEKQGLLACLLIGVIQKNKIGRDCEAEKNRVHVHKSVMEHEELSIRTSGI